MKPWLKWLISLMILALLAAGGLRVWNARKAQKIALDTQTAAQKIQAVVALADSDVVKVQNLDMAQSLPVSGPLKAVTSAFIKARVAGELQDLSVREGDFVKAGQPLVQLDPADAKVALQLAQANLALAVRQVRGLYANNLTLGAQINLRETDVVKAQNEVSRASDDLARRQSLVGNGAVSKEELAHAQSQLAQAQSTLAAAKAAVLTARDQLGSNQTLTDGTKLENHPSVEAAAAKMREAYLALHRAALPAPVDGFVAKRTVQLGQRVAAGTPLMSVIALDTLWVDANFKEVQLRNIRIGQPVKLTADLYGKHVEYKGTVAGLGAGTGAAFSLLPAQNATGNWIKVVQRVPVRVALDAKEVAAKPLRVGLSMEATVDVTQQDGKALSDAPRAASSVQTDVYAMLDEQATAAISRTIAANAGRGRNGNAP